MAVEMTEQGQVAETFHYQCSDTSCSAMVSIRIMSPLISSRFVHFLIDPEVIRKRADAAIAAEPERLEGMAIPKPIDVLDNLRLYLTNALHNPQFSKPIAPNNKRFMVSFGVGGSPCKELLEFLGFEYNEVCSAQIHQLQTLANQHRELELMATSSARSQSGHSLPRCIPHFSRRCHSRAACFD